MLRQKLKSFQSYLKYILTSIQRRRLVGEKYFINEYALPERTSDIAVVVHVYYKENLPLFKRKLKNMNRPYDLFITLPVDKVDYQDEIKNSFPEATVLIVPNRGRDVLPFIKTAQILNERGYVSVLKFHSKKSVHRNDGQDWLEGMLDCLLPDKKEVLTDIFNTLALPDTAMIGPGNVYYPLTINFPANGMHMTNIARRIYGRRKAYDYLQVHRKDFGFFGGTMFWVRLDAIESLFNSVSIDFELEAGQIDGTFAHALERMFCVVPEIEKRHIYEVLPNSLAERPYASSNIPSWSEDHDK